MSDKCNLCAGSGVVSVGQKCICQYVTSSFAEPAGSARISAKTLAEILVRHGIIDSCAIEDSEGYDGGTTALRIRNAAQEINEAGAPNDKILPPAPGGATRAQPKEMNE